MSVDSAGQSFSRQARGEVSSQLLEQMQESNNRFLVAFSASVESLKDSVTLLRANVSELTDDVRDTRIELREHRQELREHRREMREILHRIDTNTDNVRDLQADTHELRIENQRILRYLEGVNRRDRNGNPP